MSLPELIFLSAIVLVGLPSSFCNRTAAALVLSWATQEMVWILTGQTAEILTGLVLDYGVLLVILLKPGRRSFSDFVVAAIFPLMWTAHALIDDAYSRWWALWWLALAQIGASGVGAVACLRNGLAVEEDRSPPYHRFAAAVRLTWAPA